MLTGLLAAAWLSCLLASRCPRRARDIAAAAWCATAMVLAAWCLAGAAAAAPAPPRPPTPWEAAARD